MAVTLGQMNSETWERDPRKLGIMLARYKFVAKMLSGIDRVAEIGCGDGFGSRVVEQEVGSVRLTDANQNTTYTRHDIVEAALPVLYDAVYLLDVLEHIDVANENRALTNIARSLKQNGVCIIGMPSLESQDYASPISSAGHINCKSGADLVDTVRNHFHNVFLFSMSDEVVHTGFAKMAHYLLVVCCGLRHRNFR